MLRKSLFPARFSGPILSGLVEAVLILENVAVVYFGALHNTMGIFPSKASPYRREVLQNTKTVSPPGINVHGLMVATLGNLVYGFMHFKLMSSEVMVGCNAFSALQYTLSNGFGLYCTLTVCTLYRTLYTEYIISVSRPGRSSTQIATVTNLPTF